MVRHEPPGAQLRNEGDGLRARGAAQPAADPKTPQDDDRITCVDQLVSFEPHLVEDIGDAAEERSDPFLKDPPRPPQDFEPASPPRVGPE